MVSTHQKEYIHEIICLPCDSTGTAVRHVAARGVLATTVIGVLAITLFASNTLLSDRPVPNLPVSPIDPLVEAECGACHGAFHPSLLPAAEWTALMATLSDHFGEDASLDSETTSNIEAWLTAHSAETADTWPARALSQTTPEAPFTVTQTRFWQHMHGDFPDEVFTDPAVAGRSNCAACHSDANRGLFSPFAIELPKEITL